MRNRDGPRRERRAKGAKPDFVYLMGLGIYVLGAAFGCAMAAHTALVAFQFQLRLTNIAIAYGAAAAVFSVVVYALLKTHAGHIHSDIGKLQATVRRHLGRNKGPYGFGLLLLLAVMIAPSSLPEPVAPRPKAEPPSPVSSPEAARSASDVSRQSEIIEPQFEDPASPSTPLENDRPKLGTVEETIVGSRNRDKASKPVQPVKKRTANHRPADICALDEPFTERDLQACLRDIQKHPGRKGTGGPAYGIAKEDGQWKLREHQPSKRPKPAAAPSKPSAK